MTTRQPMYGTEFWRRRSKLQRRMQPLCEECLRAGVISPAQEADHVERHGGDPNKFYRGRLQSLCAACHYAKTLAENRRDPVVVHREYDETIGADGWPVDPRHPCNVDDRKRQRMLAQLEAREKAADAEFLALLAVKSDTFGE